MDRRKFLGFFSAASAGFAVGAQAAPVSVEAQQVTQPASATPGRYSIGNSRLSVEWGWRRSGWGISSRDGVQWFDDGLLNKYGRELILEHFGLQDIARQLPLEVIAMTSPAALFALRRQHEVSCGLACKNDMISDRGGDHCSAEHCA